MEKETIMELNKVQKSFVDGLTWDEFSRGRSYKKALKERFGDGVNLSTIGSTQVDPAMVGVLFDGTSALNQHIGKLLRSRRFGNLYPEKARRFNAFRLPIGEWIVEEQFDLFRDGVEGGVS